MASVDGVFSSRWIARLAEENLVYMYLSGIDKPDFRTMETPETKTSSGIALWKHKTEFKVHRVFRMRNITDNIYHNIKRTYNIQNQNKPEHLKNYRNLKKIHGITSSCFYSIL